MSQNSLQPQSSIAPWHRNKLIAAAIFTTILIAMGGVLCVTQSIRSCPDWPGCFGKILPPLEISPILEIIHRLLAAISGLLILAAAIAGLIRTRHLLWIMTPPIIAGLLVVEVSYLGALVVLHGIPPGLAAVDLSSALLVVALIVTSAVIANRRRFNPSSPDKLTFRTPFSRLVLTTVGIIFGVLVSGVLVAGQNSITSCLCWPVYSTLQYQVDLPEVGNVIRLIFSGIGIFLIISVLVQAWRSKRHHPVIFRNAFWVGAIFLIEMLVQGLLLVYNFNIFLQVTYTVTMAAFWGVLVALAINSGIELGVEGLPEKELGVS